MFNPFNWLKNRRKKGEIPSLQEAEKVISSASYSPAQPSTEFTQKLLQKLLKARRTNQKSHMETAPFFKTFRWKVWLPAVSFAAIILLLLPLLTPFFRQDMLLVNKVYAKDAFYVEALASDASGIDADAIFKITAKMPIEENELKESLRFEPEADYELKKLSETEYEVNLAFPLEAGKVHNVVIDAAYADENGIVTPKEYRFAFQVRDTFKVLNTLPGNKQDRVPLDTGIEITFSHSGVAAEDFQKHFSIEPAAAGRFEKHGRALVFVPKKPLKPETLYKITISKDLPLAYTEQKLAEDAVIEFFTDRQPTVYTDTGRYFDFIYQYQSAWPSFMPTENPEFAYHAENFPEDAAVTVYKINSLADLKARMSSPKEAPDWVCYDCYSDTVDTKGLTVVLTAKLGDVKRARDNWSNILRLPQISEQGLYVVEVKNEEETQTSRDTQIFQISNLKAFFASSQTKSFIWVHDAKNKSAAKAAKISFDDRSATYTADDNGLVIFDTPQCSELSSKHGITTIQLGSDSLVLQLSTDCISSGTLSREGSFYYYASSGAYWSTFSLDRGIYLPTDTIYFWGVAKKRDNHRPEKLTVALNLYGEELAETEATSSDLGTFQGKIEIKNAQPGYYEMQVKNEEGNMIAFQSVDIATFQKPLYRIKTEIDKKNVLFGDKVNIKIKAEFFDGTPAAGMELNYSNPNWQGALKLDKNGEAELTLDTTDKVFDDDSRYYGTYSHQMIPFMPKEAAYGVSEQTESFKVYFSKAEVWLDYELTGENLNTITGKMREIDFEKQDGDFYQTYYTGGLPDRNVDAEIYQVYHDKIETGEIYDPISKKVIPQYRYERREEKLTDLGIKTDKNGDFIINYPFQKDLEYAVKASAPDSEGRIARTRRTYSSRYVSNSESTYTAVSLRDEKNAAYMAGQSSEKKAYAASEMVELQTYVNNQPYEKESNFVYFEAQAGILNIEQSNSPKYEFRFSKKHIPNVTVGVVWFDGTYYHSSDFDWNNANVEFDKNVKKLQVEIQTDRDTYKPGDKAKITVITKDAEGKAVSAEVNLKLVDEAIYALRESYEDPLSELYNYIPSGIISMYTTARELAAEAGGKGGGGDGGIGFTRDIFKNTAYFDTVKTDSSGSASAVVDLPHDITTFRITAQAITEDIEAGSSKAPLKITLPFFAEVMHNDMYLVSDKPAFRIRAFGTELAEGAEVKFTINIPSLGVKNVEITKPAGEAYWYELPVLQTGTHEITVKAESGKYKDAIAKKFKVTESLVLAAVSETRGLANGAALADTNNDIARAKLVFSLNPYGEYYSVLQGLKWNCSGRLDSELASRLAYKLLGQYFGENVPEFSKENFSLYQAENGALMLLPYDSGNLDISYRAALFGAEYFNADGLEKYFDSVLSDEKSNREEIAMALSGKAAMSLPVLNDLKMFVAANGGNFSPRENLIVAFGFAALGDHFAANGLVDKVVATSSEREGSSLFLKPFKDEQMNLEITAQAAAVAAMADHSEAKNLWNALLRYRTSDTLTSLEKVIALQAFLKRLPAVQKGSLKYSVGNRSDKITLEKSGTESILVSADELKQINFSDVAGPVSVTVYYDAPIAQAAKSLSESLNVSRYYKINGKRATSFKEGDIVEVVLLANSSGPKANNLTITDTLPTGLLPLASIRYDYAYLGKGGISGVPPSYPYLVEGQRVAFRYPAGKEISYLARVVSKGAFKAEPAIVQEAGNEGRMNISEMQQIEIK